MQNIDMEPVDSSNIAQVGHDEDNLHLYVEFNNGSVYRYLEVPVEIYQDMLSAPSVGRFLNQEIKGNFNYERVQ